MSVCCMFSVRCFVLFQMWCCDILVSRFCVIRACLHVGYVHQCVCTFSTSTWIIYKTKPGKFDLKCRKEVWLLVFHCYTSAKLPRVVLFSLQVPIDLFLACILPPDGSTSTDQDYQYCHVISLGCVETYVAVKVCLTMWMFKSADQQYESEVLLIISLLA